MREMDNSSRSTCAVWSGCGTKRASLTEGAGEPGRDGEVVPARARLDRVVQPRNLSAQVSVKEQAQRRTCQRTASEARAAMVDSATRAGYSACARKTEE